MGVSLRTERGTAPALRSRPEGQAQPGAAGHVSALKLVSLSLYWIAIGYLWNGLHTLILPDLMLRLVSPTYRATALGFVENTGLLVATLWQPIVGAFSDHTSSRWGRRRPYILGGTLADIPFLIALALIGNYWLLVLVYVMLQMSSNTAHGPYQALMPDVVPEKQRGEASGYYGFFNMLGVLGGIAVVGAIASRFGTPIATLSMIAVLLVAMALTVVLIRDHTPAAPGPVPGPRRVMAASFTEPVRNRDFMWVSVCRLLITMALVGLQTFMFFYLYDTWFPGSSKATISGASILVGLIVVITALASLPAGMLSDRFGRRRIIVSSGVVTSVGFVGLALSHYVWLPSSALHPLAQLLGARDGAVQVVLYGLPIGLGLGGFLTVNWAQMTELIPEAQFGAYMGFFNIATTGAGILSRLIGGALLDFFNVRGELFGLKAGYPTLFIFLGLLALIGGFTVLKARETRKEAT